MATTTLTLRANRSGSTVYLGTSVASVALDATVDENFILPVGFGDLLIQTVRLTISSLSGAYVAPAPAYDGFVCSIGSVVAGDVADLVCARRFVNTLTQTGRPVLDIVYDVVRVVLCRQNERIQVAAPLLAGAGVTGTVSCAVRGIRTRVS